MRQRRQYSLRERLLLVLLICFVGGGIFFLFHFSRFQESDDISWELQGYMMIIRIPPQRPLYDQIFISPTGHVVRQLFLPPSGSEGVGNDLTLAELQTVETLRSQWCIITPAAHKQVVESSSYTIGINCGGFLKDKRITLERSNMPMQLMMLITRQPPLLERDAR